MKRVITLYLNEKKTNNESDIIKFTLSQIVQIGKLPHPAADSTRKEST
jgi:hypothetical protein